MYKTQFSVGGIRYRPSSYTPPETDLTMPTDPQSSDPVTQTSQTSQTSQAEQTTSTTSTTGASETTGTGQNNSSQTIQTTQTTTQSAQSDQSEPSQNDKPAYAFWYLKKNLNLPNYQIHAILGMIDQESKWNLNAENKYEKENENYKYGIGLMQWTGDRHQKFKDFTQGDCSLKRQLDFLIHEFNGYYKPVLDHLKNTKNLNEAVNILYAGYLAGDYFHKKNPDINKINDFVKQRNDAYKKKWKEIGSTRNSNYSDDIVTASNKYSQYAKQGGKLWHASRIIKRVD